MQYNGYLKLKELLKAKTIYKVCSGAGHFSQFNEPSTHITVKQKGKIITWFDILCLPNVIFHMY